MFLTTFFLKNTIPISSEVPTSIKKKEDIEVITLEYIVYLKLFAGKATSGPPLGPILGQCGIPAAPFCILFNERTNSFFKKTIYLDVHVYIFSNGDYDFDIKFPHNSYLLKKLIDRKHFSGTPGFIFTNLALEQKIIAKKKKRSKKKTKVRSIYTKYIVNRCVTPFIIYEFFLYQCLHRTDFTTQVAFSFCSNIKGFLKSAGISYWLM